MIRDQAQDKVDAVLATTAASQKAHPELRIEQFGGASAGKAVDKMFADDLHKAETISLPVTLIILLFAFGAIVAAGLPLLLGLTAVLGTMGVVAGVSQFSPATDNLMSVVLLVGLAVGVDYSLFYIRREREERKAGRSPEAALEAAAATSGRTVLVSGFTVMAAMAGMYLTGDKGFSSMATGTILVVGVAMLGSLTVLPAMLSKLGDNVDRGRIPFLGKRMAARSESRAWSWMLDRVLKRPLAAALISGGLLVALSIPALGLHTANSGTNAIPQNTPVMKTYNRLTEAFPGAKNTAQVVVKADDVTKPRVASAIRSLEQKATAAGTAVDDITTDISRDQHRRDDRHPDRRQRQRQRSPRPLWRRSATTSSRRRSEASARRRGARQRRRRREQGLQRHAEGARADRVPVRPRPRVPAAARRRSGRS